MLEKGEPLLGVGVAWANLTIDTLQGDTYVARLGPWNGTTVGSYSGSFTGSVQVVTMGAVSGSTSLIVPFLGDSYFWVRSAIKQTVSYLALHIIYTPF